MSSETQTIFISLVGTTPAVLTETVWALANDASEPVIPDRIVAITTAPGRNALHEQLFDTPRWEELLTRLRKEGHEIEGRLRFGPVGDAIRVFPDSGRSRELDDIRSLAESEAVAEFLMETLRGFTENDATELIVSIAGGRKTTSALLHSVMTLLGRARDRITHVIVDDCWVRNRGFYFPGCSGEFFDEDGEPLDSHSAKVDLVPVPFVPLRYLFKRDLERSAGSYLKLISQVRTKTLNVEDDLEVQLDSNSGSLTVNGQTIQASPSEFIIYLYFARRASASEGPLHQYGDGEAGILALQEESKPREDFGHWAWNALEGFNPKEDIRKNVASLKSKLKRAGFDEFQCERLLPCRGNLAIDLLPEVITID